MSREDESGARAASEFARGWGVLLAAFVGVGVGVSSLMFYSQGIFIKPLQDEFGWSRTETSLSSLVSVLCLAAISPSIGGLIDRFGIRAVAAISLAMLALAFVALRFMPGSIWAFYGIIAASAFLAAGSSPVTFTRAVNGWFDRSRGLALGLALVGTGVAAVLAPRFLTPFVAEQGWRAGYLALAALVAVSIPVVALFLRDGSAAVQSAAGGLTLEKARRTRVFWIMMCAFFFTSLAVGGLIVHFVPMMTDAGLGPAEAGAVASWIGVAVITGRVVTGALIDRLFAPRVGVALMLLVAGGCVTLLVGGTPYAPVAAFAIGFAIGAEVDLIGYLVARYFGLRQYGRIYGWQYAAFLLGTGFSPAIAGAVFDAFGSYDFALMGSVTCLLLSVGMLLMMPRFPARPAAGPDA